MIQLKKLATALLILLGMYATAQGSQKDTTNQFLTRIFLPSIDAGFQIPNSDVLEGSVRFSTAIEYRIRNNNDFFIRLSYETYGVGYKLQENSRTSNNIEGTVQMSDIFLAPGYRMGDNTFRLMVSFMPGIKLYEFPTATADGQQFLISQKSKSLFTTSVLTTLEYYFDQKSALTFSLYQNQVWQDVDFWEDGRSMFGFSIGFITSLI